MVDLGYKRKNSGVGRVFLFVLVVLIIAVGFVYYRSHTKKVAQEVEQKAEATKILAETSTTTQILTSDTAKWKRASDPKKLFTFSYPSKFFTASAPEVNVPPEFTQKVKATQISYKIPKEHCGLSGLPEHCTPYTENLTISFFVAEKNFNEVLKGLQKAYGGDLTVVSVDGHQGVKFSLGAEGEGAVYYVVPVNNMNTLFISRSYMDESILTGYRGVEGFMTVAEQKQVFDKILSTFKFGGAVSIEGMRYVES